MLRGGREGGREWREHRRKEDQEGFEGGDAGKEMEERVRCLGYWFPGLCTVGP